jgi:catechol 2,3-dioxygenase
MSIQKVAHVEIRVEDLDAALDFHTDVLGLTELARDNGTVYLGCGIDDTYDLALTNGGTGVTRVALQVDEADLDTFRTRLQGMGVDVEESTDRGPGSGTSLRFSAPSGHVFDLMTVTDRPVYLQPAKPKHARGKGMAPTDLDHVTLRTPDVKGLVEFLREALDFKVSDVFEPGPGVWAAAWTRVGEYHHDIAMLSGGPDETLDHVAFTMDGADHLKKAADILAQAEIPIETGPGRHGIGGNLFTYFWAPGGNRYELSAEMPRTVSPNAPHNVWNDFPKAFSAWGQMPPESFAKGS